MLDHQRGWVLAAWALELLQEPLRTGSHLDEGWKRHDGKEGSEGFSQLLSLDATNEDNAEGPDLVLNVPEPLQGGVVPHPPPNVSSSRSIWAASVGAILEQMSWNTFPFLSLFLLPFIQKILTAVSSVPHTVVDSADVVILHVG